MDKLRSLKSLPDELVDMYPDNPIVRAFIDKYRNWGFEDKEHMLQEMAIALAKDWERQQDNIETLLMHKGNNPKIYDGSGITVKQSMNGKKFIVRDDKVIDPETNIIVGKCKTIKGVPEDE